MYILGFNPYTQNKNIHYCPKKKQKQKQKAKKTNKQRKQQQ
jgi:hypothetical protein